MIDEIIKKTDRLRTREAIRSRRRHRSRYNSDELLYYCESCKSVWEYKKIYSDNNRNPIMKYSHIPTYGKVRKQCKYCKSKDCHWFFIHTEGQISPRMGEVSFYLVQGIITLSAFFLGAYVYHRGQINKPPSPILNLDKQEEQPQANWDELWLQRSLYPGRLCVWWLWWFTGAVGTFGD